MNVTNVAIAALGFLYGVAIADEPVEPTAVPESPPTVLELTDNNERVNYSLGYELGQDLKRQELELAPEVLLKGAEDALKGQRPLVDTRRRQAALKEIKEQRNKENLEKSQAFLAANAEKEGVTTLPSGLQYREIRAGEGKTAEPTGRVTVNYRGTLIDGTEFDSSYERGRPSTFQVKRVIKGWAEAMQLMKEGAKWELVVPPDLAYGNQSPRKRIPPNSALIYEVELLSVDKGLPPPEAPRPLAPPTPGAGE